jgi:hypothetical protein
MRNASTKRAVLVLLGTLLAIVVCVGTYELVEGVRYEQWKEGHRNSQGWFGGLTIQSSNPVLIWEYRTNGLYENTALDYSIRTNRFGFRGSDGVTEEKPAGNVPKKCSKKRIRGFFISD